MPRRDEGPFDSRRLATVEILQGNGQIAVINETEFDPEVHVRMATGSAAAAALRAYYAPGGGALPAAAAILNGDEPEPPPVPEKLRAAVIAYLRSFVQGRTALEVLALLTEPPDDRADSARR
jgi:hypothetical protein